MESKKRSFYRSLIWRAMGIVVLAAVTYYFTKKMIITTLISLTHHATFIIVFYLHERLWLKLKKPAGKLRNIIKAFTYEIILGMGIGGLIVYIFTGEWSKVTQITITYTIIKIIMYYFYDRIGRGKEMI